MDLNWIINYWPYITGALAIIGINLPWGKIAPYLPKLKGKGTATDLRPYASTAMRTLSDCIDTLPAGKQDGFRNHLLELSPLGLLKPEKQGQPTQPTTEAK